MGGLKVGERETEGSGEVRGEITPLSATRAEVHEKRQVAYLFKLGPEEGDLRQASVVRASEFAGVNRALESKHWKAQIAIGGNKSSLGNSNSEEEAARAYDERAAALGRSVSFPKEGPEQAVELGSSKYRGVSKKSKRWAANITIDRKMKHLGTFDSEETAAQKYDEAAAPLGRQVNFPIALVMARAGANTPLSYADLQILK